MKYCLTQKPHLFFKFDNRNSFIENSRAKILGVVAGISYGNRLLFGIGYNQLYPPATNFDTRHYYTNKYGMKDSATQKLKLFYVSAAVEYAFYQTEHWQFSMPLQIGAGNTWYTYTIDGENKKEGKTFNFVYEPSVSVEYKPVKWVGVGAGIGYRFMITPSRRLNQKFTSPIYAFKLLIYYTDIFRYFFPNAHVFKKNRK